MTILDRRRLVGTAAAALAGAVAGPAPRGTESGRGEGTLRRDASVTENPSPGFFRFALGDVELTVLSAGHFHFPPELLTVDVQPREFLAYNVEPETREEYFRSRLVPSDHVPLQMSPVLIDTGRRRVLVDCGGRLDRSLEAAGIPPESIDTVIPHARAPGPLWGDSSIRPPARPSSLTLMSSCRKRSSRSGAATTPLRPTSP